MGGNIPSTEKSNAAPSTNAAGQPQGQQPTQAPVPQITAAPQFVRQAYSGPMPMGYTGAGIAGGPLAGFSGMGGGQQQQQQQGYMGGGFFPQAMAPQMQMGGGFLPPQAQNTASMVQQYDPFAARQMPTVPQIQMPDAYARGDFGGTPWDGDMLGQYEMDRMMAPDMAGPAAAQVGDSEFGTLAAPLEYHPGEDPYIEKEYEMDSTAAPTDATWADMQEEGWTHVGMDPHSGERRYRSPDGNVYEERDGTLIQIGHSYTEGGPGSGGPTEYALAAGQIAGAAGGVDDATYDYYMGENITGWDSGDKVEGGYGLGPDHDLIEQQYAEAEANRQQGVAAATRAFRDWAGRSGVAFNPGAMGQAAAQFEAQVRADEDELNMWRADSLAAETQAGNDRMRQHVENYYTEAHNLLVDHLNEVRAGTEGSFSTSVAYEQYVDSMVSKMIEMEMSHEQITNALTQMRTLYTADTGGKIFEDRANADDETWEEVTGTNASGIQG